MARRQRHGVIDRDRGSQADDGRRGSRRGQARERMGKVGTPKTDRT